MARSKIVEGLADALDGVLVHMSPEEFRSTRLKRVLAKHLKKWGHWKGMPRGDAKEASARLKKKLGMKK